MSINYKTGVECYVRTACLNTLTDHLIIENEWDEELVKSDAAFDPIAFDFSNEIDNESTLLCILQVLKDAVKCGFDITPTGEDLWSDEILEQFKEEGTIEFESADDMISSTTHFLFNFLRPFYELSWFEESYSVLLSSYEVRPLVAFYLAHFVQYSVFNEAHEDYANRHYSKSSDQVFFCGGTSATNSSFLNHLNYKDSWEQYSEPLLDDYVFMKPWLSSNQPPVGNSLDRFHLQSHIDELEEVVQKNIKLRGAMK